MANSFKYFFFRWWMLIKRPTLAIHPPRPRDDTLFVRMEVGTDRVPETATAMPRRVPTRVAKPSSRDSQTDSNRRSFCRRPSRSASAQRRTRARRSNSNKDNVRLTTEVEWSLYLIILDARRSMMKGFFYY